MSERPTSHEHHEALPLPEKHELLTAHTKHEKQEKRAEQDPHQLASEARKHIMESSTSQEVLRQHLTEEDTPDEQAPRTISQELKRITLQRELQAIRRKLPRSERGFSKLVHQPVVRAVSEVTSKTVSRPSGMLGGGIVAFLGSLGYLYLAKHVGFKYNYFVFLVLFVAGFVIGVALEFIVYVALSSRRRAHD